MTFDFEIQTERKKLGDIHKEWHFTVCFSNEMNIVDIWETGIRRTVIRLNENW